MAPGRSAPADRYARTVFTKQATIGLFVALLAIFILLRVYLNFGGAGGFAFNVITFVAIFMGASYVWQRSELNQRRR